MALSYALVVGREFRSADAADAFCQAHACPFVRYVGATAIRLYVGGLFSDRASAEFARPGFDDIESGVVVVPVMPGDFMEKLRAASTYCMPDGHADR